MQVEHYDGRLTLVGKINSARKMQHWGLFHRLDVKNDVSEESF